jgi:methylene-fatty-acyl-phospholipid synthase
LTKIFRSPYYGCYALAVTIFSIGIIRDSLYKAALDEQPLYPAIHYPVPGAILFCAGNVLVLSSMWALGVTGTYLGDYFGILMESKVEGFPFNVTGAPMYWGSTLSFLGTALYKGRTAGVLLTLEVFVMYLIALQFEEYVLNIWELVVADSADAFQPIHCGDLCKERSQARDSIDDEAEGA